jgi:O-succinylbenzoate synthase
VSAQELVDIRVLSLPLKSSFRGVTSRELMIFRGQERYAEFSPFLEYQDQEAATWLQAALAFANEDLPDLKRDAIPVNATLPAVNGDRVEQLLENFPGFRTVKIKVAEKGQLLQDDIARIRAVKKLHPDVKIRLDANGGFTVNQALNLLESLREIELEYFEQPVASIAELVQLRSALREIGSNLKIAADESIRKATDPLLVARERAADIAVIKMQPLGGVARAKEIAQDSGLEIVVSSALESSLGIAQGLYLAGSLENLDYDCGLWTQNLFTDDIVKTPLKVQNASISVAIPELDPEKLERYRVSPDRERFWMQRLERCLDLL